MTDESFEMTSSPNQGGLLGAAAKGAFIGLVASFTIRLAEHPLTFLIWTTFAVVVGATASLLYELTFRNPSPDARVDSQESDIPLVVTSAQLRMSEKVLLQIPKAGNVEIALQPTWKDKGLLKIHGLSPTDNVITVRLRVVDE